MPPSFTLPPNWYRLTVTELVETTLPPLLGNLTSANAWAYVYAITMWSEDYQGASYMHLVETNSLNTATGRRLADRGADYMRNHMAQGGSCDPFALVDRIGQRYAAERQAQGLPPPARRDPNTTGNAFEAALQVLIGKICDVVPSRTPTLRTLQGFELAPEGYHSKPDLILFGPRDFRLLISTKWTLRKERIGTYLHESYFYKQRRPDLQVAFVVSEFQPSILRHLSTDPLVDRVYHVNKRMLLDLYDPFAHLPPGPDVLRATLTGAHRNATAYQQWMGMKDRLFDLTDLFEDITSLHNKPAQVLDPDARGDDEGE